MQMLIVFGETFDALEFLDMVDKDDIIDHFDMPDFKKKIQGNPFSLPSEITPHSIILDMDMSKYDSLLHSFSGAILETCIL